MVAVFRQFEANPSYTATANHGDCEEKTSGAIGQKGESIMAGGCCARRALALGLLTLMLGALGCATAKKWKSAFAPPPDERKVERETAVSDFEKRRTQVQLTAAQERLALGEVDDARRMLRDILKRQPSCRDATLMLAVLHADDEDYRSAEQVLVAGLRQNSADAELHHALGTILELNDRLPQAKAHFAQACQLAPGNHVFRDSLASLNDLEAAPPLVAARPARPTSDKVTARIAD